MNRLFFMIPVLALVPRVALAEEPAAATPAAAAAPAASSVTVDLAADDAHATLERRVSTTSAPSFPIIETGIFQVGQWEQSCVAPCSQKLDPRYTYRVAGDGLVPTDSFSLPKEGHVKVDATMGSSTGRVLGGVATGAGILAFAAGGLALIATPILDSNDVGSKGFRSGVLAGGVGAVSVGVLAAGVGLFLWMTNGSHAHTESVARASSSTSTQ